MNMKEYTVIINNDIFGNSEHVMTKSKISKFNLCALGLSDLVDKDGESHTAGMWTVRPVAKDGQHEI